MSNNPVNRTDPTGHRETGACGVNGEECGGNIPPGNGGGSGGGGGNPGGGSNECNLGEVCISNSHTGEPELIADDGNTGVYSACGYKFMNSIAPGEFGNDKTCSEDYWLTIPRNRVWEYQYYGVARPGWLGALMPNFYTFASYIPLAGSTISTWGTVTNMANGAQGIRFADALIYLSEGGSLDIDMRVTVNPYFRTAKNLPPLDSDGTMNFTRTSYGWGGEGSFSESVIFSVTSSDGSHGTLVIGVSPSLASDWLSYFGVSP